MTDVVLDWFIQPKLTHNSGGITIEEVLSIAQEAEYHPQSARQRLMEWIDFALDRKDEKEFQFLSGMLLTL